MKKFLIIWAGEFVSNIGSGMTAFALAVYVLQMTKSVTWVSAVTLLAYLPTILLNPLGGVLADRFDRRLMMICGDLFSAFGLIYILFSIRSGSDSITPILVGVTINAVFVSLLDPSYKATITDLLTAEEFAKASGLVQIAGNAKYLISPALAGILLGIADIQLILMIDICTIFVTVLAVLAVRKSLAVKSQAAEKWNLLQDFKEGAAVIFQTKGVGLLVLLMALMCFFIGFIQTLMVPMILPLADAKTVGIMESVSALGMLGGSIVIGIKGIKKNHIRILTGSLALSGLFMALTGMSTHMTFILPACMLFFVTLPFVNTCADVLIRVSIPNQLQGRVWGLISLLTQIGYVAAYGLCGVLADQVFEPLLKEGGQLAPTIGQIIGTGEGRGIGLMLITAGILMAATAFIFGQRKSIRMIKVGEEL